MAHLKTRAIETLKKKRRRVIPRSPVSRNLGNAGAGRRKAKKMGAIARMRTTAA